MAQWVQLVCLAHLELAKPVLQDTLGSLESQVYQVGMELQEPMVCKGQRVTLEPLGWEHQERQVRMVPQVCLGLWGKKVPRDILDSLEQLACQVLANQVQMECQEREDLQAHQAPLARRGSLGQWVSLVSQVVMGLWAQLVHRVLEDSRERQVCRDLKAISVWWEHQGKRGPRVTRELRVTEENLVCQG